MSRHIQIVLAAVYIGMVIGVGHGIANQGINPLTIAVVAIVLGTFTGVVKSISKSGATLDTDNRDQRLAELEGRISDLQDIVLSIDDKLSRPRPETTKTTNVSSD